MVWYVVHWVKRARKFANPMLTSKLEVYKWLQGSAHTKLGQLSWLIANATRVHGRNIYSEWGS